MTKLFMLSALLVVALAACASTLAEKTRYDYYRLVRLNLRNQAQISLIETWDQNEDFDLWFVERSELKYADVLLSPSAFAKYQAIFTMNEIKFEILHNNMQNIIDEEERTIAKSKQSRANIINKFATYADVNSFISDTVSSNPQIATTYTAGKSVEGRNLNVIVLKTATSTKPVWIDCGIHAREWVSHPTCIYIIDQLVNDYASQGASSLISTYEFHILPLVNPDGYEFSRTSTRLWRKNRRVNSGSTCLGVDLNRNYDFQWMVNNGASADPCSETFAGATPNSEPETLAVESAINAKKGQWIAFFTLHSYGQWWLISFGDSTTPAADYAEMERVATAGVNAIKAVDNRKFVAGQSSVLLYVNSGSSQDWAKGRAGVKYSYTLELRPGQGASDAFWGFLLPEGNLLNLTKETFAGIKAALAAI